MTTAEKRKVARQMALDGRYISEISDELGISWNEAAGYTLSWLGAKKRITNRLAELAEESNQSRRERLVEEVDHYVDFLYDAAKHLRLQVDGARRALNR